jgi:hypothetical protein
MTFSGLGLLDRLNTLMVVNVALADDRLIDYADLLRLIDARRIVEAIELVRVLFSYLGGSTAAGEDTACNVTSADVTTAIGTSGRTCWVRHMLAAAASTKRREPADEFAKSYYTLLSILNATKRAIAENRRNIRYRSGKQLELFRRVRELPDAYRTFYWLADVRLASRSI